MKFLAERFAQINVGDRVRQGGRDFGSPILRSFSILYKRVEKWAFDGVVMRMSAGSKRKVEHRQVVEQSLSITAHIMSELYGTSCPVDQIDSFRTVNLIGRLVTEKCDLVAQQEMEEALALRRRNGNARLRA